MKKFLVILTVSLLLLTACEPGDFEATAEPDSMAEDAMIEETVPEETEPVETETTEPLTSDLSSTPQRPTPGMSKEIEITINNSSFEYGEWVIHEDSVVKWTNLDDVSHTVVVVKTSDSYDDLEDSEDDYDDDYRDDDGEYKNRFEFTLSPGQSFSYTFDDDGRYEFSLTDKEGAVGLIHVSDDYEHDRYDDDDDYDDDYDDDDDDDDYDDDDYDDNDDDD